MSSRVYAPARSSRLPHARAPACACVAEPGESPDSLLFKSIAYRHDNTLPVRLFSAVAYRRPSEYTRGQTRAEFKVRRRSLLTLNFEPVICFPSFEARGRA